MEETSKQVRKLAHLARLSLTPEERGSWPDGWSRWWAI